jgi:hypothetical protein
MPLEVRQIGIRMQIGDDADGAPAVDSGASRSPLDLLRGANDDDESGEMRLVEQCVERVLAELARRSER